MLPLAGFFVVSVAIIFDRLFVFAYSKSFFKRRFLRKLEDLFLNKEKKEDFLEFLKEHRKNYLIADVLYRGILEDSLLFYVKKTVSLLEKRLDILHFSGNISPVLGFLGTVSGMITSFSAMAGDRIADISKGISEALITTEFGLIISIISFTALFFFQRVVDGIKFELEEVYNRIQKKW